MGPGMGAVVAALVATVVMSGLPGMEGGWGGIIPRPRSRSRLFPAAIAPLAAALAAFSQPSVCYGYDACARNFLYESLATISTNVRASMHLMQLSIGVKANCFSQRTATFADNDS